MICIMLKLDSLGQYFFDYEKDKSTLCNKSGIIIVTAIMSLITANMRTINISINQQEWTFLGCILKISLNWTKENFNCVKYLWIEFQLMKVCIMSRHSYFQYDR